MNTILIAFGIVIVVLFIRGMLAAARSGRNNRSYTNYTAPGAATFIPMDGSSPNPDTSNVTTDPGHHSHHDIGSGHSSHVTHHSSHSADGGASHSHGGGFDSGSSFSGGDSGGSSGGSSGGGDGGGGGGSDGGGGGT